MNAKKGFTLIEILVASLLLGMLVTILTMVFNSSAIAWRTGKAGVSKMSKVRWNLSYSQYLADNLLPRVSVQNKSTDGRILGAWDKNGDPRKRAVEKFSSASTWFSKPGWNSDNTPPNSPAGSGGFSGGGNAVASWVPVQQSLLNIQRNSGSAYIVGVWSYGPDGLPNTEDDINTWPEDVQ